MTFLCPASFEHSIVSMGDFLNRQPLNGRRGAKSFFVLSKLKLSKSVPFKAWLFGSQRFVFDTALEPLMLRLGSTSKLLRLERIKEATDQQGKLRHGMNAQARVIVTAIHRGEQHYDLAYKVDVPVGHTVEQNALGFTRYTDLDRVTSDVASGPTGMNKTRINLNGQTDRASANEYWNRYQAHNPHCKNSPLTKRCVSEINAAVRLDVLLDESTVTSNGSPSRFSNHQLRGSADPLTFPHARGGESRVASMPAVQQREMTIVDLLGKLQRATNFDLSESVELAKAYMANKRIGRDGPPACLLDTDFAYEVTAQLEDMLEKVSAARQSRIGQQEQRLAFIETRVAYFLEWVDDQLERLGDSDLDDLL